MAGGLHGRTLWGWTTATHNACLGSDERLESRERRRRLDLYIR